jgi:hypothetical protein
MTKPNAAPAYTFFLVVALTAIVVLLLVVGANYLVDPYFIHQWDTPALKRPTSAQQKILPWGKTYAALRYQPEVLLLGSSRSEIGLPADSSLLAGKRVFNLAISGASVGDAARMLRHSSHFHQPELIIWGLDYGWQFREKTGNTDFLEELEAKDDLYPWRRIVLDLKRGMSLPMVGDTLAVLSGSNEQSCLSLIAYHGFKAAPCLEVIMKNEGGTRRAFEEVLKKKAPLGAPDDTPATVTFLEETLKSSCTSGTRVRLFIQPLHALAELSYWNGLESDVEEWKRKLTGMADRLRGGGCDLALYDFSGYNRITTEQIPQQTGREIMQHYWEQSHYNGGVGEMIIAKVLHKESAKESEDFGVDLRPETVEHHLAATRLARRRYIEAHPGITAHLDQKQ